MDNERVVYPSFEFERRTRAFNRYLLPFVSLVSMFSVGIIIGGSVYAFTSSFIELPVNHLDLFIWVPMALFILSIGTLIKFMLSLLTSYKFENGRIVRGIITIKVFGYGVGETYSGRGSLIKLIKINTTPGLAELYFDTDGYKKKEYLQPRLIRETGKMLVFKCSNGRKLRIPKIYEDICEEKRTPGISFIARILLISLVVFAASFVFAMADLAVLKYKTVTDYGPSITATVTDVGSELAPYGYEQTISKSAYAQFSKQVGERTSAVSYNFDKHGNIKNVRVQLYYNSDSEEVENELRAIIGTMNAGFAENDIDEFITAVEDSLSGEYHHYKLSSDSYALIVGMSGDYVDIH